MYLAAGLDVLGATGWARRPGLAFALGLERAECEYLNGQFEAAEALLAELLASPDDLKWGPAPSGLPAGAQLALLYGDPSKEGPFVVRLKLPPSYQIPAHRHATAEDAGGKW